MKIVCQSCSAKYSIADDKVQGKKVFKIKCKKCGEDILVRGADAAGDPDASASHAAYAPAQEQFGEDEATRVVSGESADAIWHAVVGGDQQGPFSVAQLRDMLGTGAITEESFVWKDGFTNWKPLRDVPELAVATMGAAPAAAPAASGGDLFGSPAPAAAPAATAAAAGGGLFASAVPAKAAASEAKARAGSKAAAGGDLFGSDGGAGASRGLFGGEEDVSTSASASPRVDAKQAMTGQRNENSVLFSLATLQQVAGAQGSAKVSEPGGAGKANSDQSGLIDIKSMAATFGPGGPSKQKAVDEILTVGGGGALASPLAAPVLAPVPTPATAVAEPEKPQGANKTVLFAVIAVAVILAGGGIGVAMLLRNNNAASNNPPAPIATPTVPAAPAAPGTPAPAGAAAGAAAGTTVAANTEAANPAGAAAGAAAGTTVAANTEAANPAGNAAGEATGRGEPRGTRERPTRERTAGSSSSSTASAPAAPAAASNNSAATAPPAPSGGSCAARCRGNIDCLLRCSTESPGARAPQPAAQANLPEAPTRNDVLNAMRSVAGAVNACANGQTGTATVSITFASNGRVTTATVAPPFSGPAGSCIARAVRSATVPPFSRPTFQVNYPFVIR